MIDTRASDALRKIIDTDYRWQTLKDRDLYKLVLPLAVELEQQVDALRSDLVVSKESLRCSSDAFEQTANALRAERDKAQQQVESLRGALALAVHR